MEVHGELNENVYAFNVEWKEIFIDDVIEKGRAGYYCLGCRREMQAILSIKGNRRNYFRHDAKAAKNEGKCTYSDETFRHKLAKEILGRIKKVKVPSIYKFPPVGIDGRPVLIESSKVVSAHSVRNELCFYEDENCNVFWGTGDLVDQKYLLIRPDITFFDSENYPILFVEIEVTNMLTDEKINKIKRLGVDTIKIKIPKDSPQSIEKSFYTTTHTKWVYSNVESNTEYIQIPESFDKGISPIDEIPEKFYNESYKCRRSQIRALIQRIRTCLETEQYRRTVQEFESEISRIEKSTRELKDRIDEYRASIREKLEEKYHQRNNSLKEKEGLLNRGEEEFRKYKNNLDERYNRKAGKLSEIIEWAERHNEIADPETRRKIGEEEKCIKRETAECENDRINIREQQEYGKQLQEKYRRIQEEIGVEFEFRTRSSIEQIETRSSEGNGEFGIKINRLLEARKLIDDFEGNVNDYRRYRKAKELFDQRVFKSWD